MRLGFLGTGTISAAVVRGLAGRGHRIAVSERSAGVSAQLAAEIAEVTVAANQAVVDQSDVLFLGLMAEAAPEILAPLTFRPDQRVISFMAGAGLPDIAAMVAPAKASAVMLPFPGIAAGGSPILRLGDAELVEALFAPQNTIFALESESELEAYLCAQAVLSPAARLVADAGAWLGSRVADAERGEAFLRMLVATSLAGTRSTDLIAALNTPGGYNQRLRLHMEESGMGEALVCGLDGLEG